MNTASSRKRILVLGGYGSFGARLSRLLTKHTTHLVVVAGRNLSAAQKHCDEFGGVPAELNRLAITDCDLQKIGVDILVDATGPFSMDEADPYRVVSACLKANTHYTDLSDDGDFTCRITQFHRAAVSRELLVTSGASTVPSISAAIAKSLTEDIARVEYIETSILPGNRAPRGLSLMKSILHQTGRPIKIWRDGVETSVPGWSSHRRKRVDVKGTIKLRPRWSALIGAPDVELFPNLFGAENVCLRAGLELNIMQFGLMALSIFPRLHLVRTLRPLALPLRFLANLLEPFGSDAGGMLVEVGGRQMDGTLVEKVWALHAASGEGPFIPALSAFILCNKIANGTNEIGALPCIGLLSEREIADGLTLIDASTQVHCAKKRSLFETTLGEQWTELPIPLRNTHAVLRRRAFRGTARVLRGTSSMATLLCFLLRFPPTSEKTPVEVIFEKRKKAEIWHRNFGGHSFRSTLTCQDEAKGEIIERFGLFFFTVLLQVVDGELHFTVTKGRALWIPLPSFLLPKSDAKESIDADGHFKFQIELSIPWIGRIIMYEGRLEPAMQNATLSTKLPDPS